MDVGAGADTGAGAGAGAVVPAGEDIYDYYIKNNLYSDFRTYNEAHPWLKEDITKYMTVGTLMFFANYSKKGFMIYNIDDNKNIRVDPVLFIACDTKLPEIIMYLIMSGKCDITALNNINSSLLIRLIYNNQNNIIKMLLTLEINKLKPLIGIQNLNKSTVLIWACYRSLSDIALALIATGESNPGAQSIDGWTALINACAYGMTKVALALIATGESNPGAQSKNGYTALINACAYPMSEVALALIKTGESNPNAQIDNGYTALMYACTLNMPDVALALIATGNCNSLAVNEFGRDALYYAKTPELKFWIRREQAYERRRYVLRVGCAHP
jgi:ankyrin repeat protein